MQGDERIIDISEGRMTRAAARAVANRWLAEALDRVEDPGAYESEFDATSEAIGYARGAGDVLEVIENDMIAEAKAEAAQGAPNVAL